MPTSAAPTIADTFSQTSVLDFLPDAQRRSLQSQRLRETVRRVYDHVGTYRSRMQNVDIEPNAIGSIDDITRLPFTYKTDLRDAYPYGMFTCPMQDIVRLHASSGTTGKPIIIGYTREDIDLWRHVMMRSLACCGVRPTDIVQNAFGYGLFTGGLGVQLGAEGLGATVAPASSENIVRQVMLMRDLRSTVICSTPTTFLHLVERAVEMGVDLHDLPLRLGVFGAEPWTEAMRAHLEAASGIKAYDIYGLSEIIGPGVAAEAVPGDGLCVFDDCFYPEIIDPQTNEPANDGEEGELVLTTLRNTAMPLIRYRTRDLTRFVTEPASDGRTLRRIERIRRRADDMFIIDGQNIFPSQIETVLLGADGLLPHYQIVLSREAGRDVMTVVVESDALRADNGDKASESVRRDLAELIHAGLGVQAGVELVEPNSMERVQGKAKRLIDKRDSNGR